MVFPPDPHRDPHRAARGLVNGLLLSIPFWLLAYCAVSAGG